MQAIAQRVQATYSRLMKIAFQAKILRALISIKALDLSARSAILCLSEMLSNYAFDAGFFLQS